MGITASLEDPHGVLENWDGDSVDPCSWTMVTCSAESLVIGLLLLQNNDMTGPIPAEIGRLSKLHTLDISNYFEGGLTITVSGAIPVSLANMTQLVFL
ncbi:NSP-interacting kinase 1 [Actinidia rufa]|uniref:NSP-interacting kinase 1 n=1 Tax=Actinidia rufa TaxID=165716 RepID=A0A7J0H7R0_9ERIC|nr:NSP-interacting kinase 1 [Actinidia rufa]